MKRPSLAGRRSGSALATIVGLVGLAWLAAPQNAAASDYRISVVDTGTRSYYCTATVRLENGSAETINDLNGYLVLLVAEDDVGESWGSSFLDVAAGAASEVTFEAPNAPCEAVTGFRFVVGACRVGESFHDQAVCADRLDTVAPIREAVAR